MSAPRKGDPITYRGALIGEVTLVDGDLCWYKRFKDNETDVFIWNFKSGPNELHGWPTKNEVTP